MLTIGKQDERCFRLLTDWCISKGGRCHSRSSSNSMIQTAGCFNLLGSYGVWLSIFPKSAHLLINIARRTLPLGSASIIRKFRGSVTVRLLKYKGYTRLIQQPLVVKRIVCSLVKENSQKLKYFMSINLRFKMPKLKDMHWKENKKFSLILYECGLSLFRCESNPVTPYFSLVEWVWDNKGDL